MTEPVQKRTQKNVHRTSITMPIPTKDELDRIRGTVSFSEQIVNDLNAYWEAVRAGMQTLEKRVFRKEAAYLARAIGNRDWASMKLGQLLLQAMIEDVEEGPRPNEGVNVPLLIDKLKSLTMLELLALINWLRITAQLGETPEKAAAIFPQG